MKAALIYNYTVFFGRLQKSQNFQDLDTNSAKLKYIERPKYIELKYKMAKIQKLKCKSNKPKIQKD